MAGVQCEACHGPGSLYKSPKVMSKGRYRKDPMGQRKLAVEASLVLQDKGVCLGCHDAERPAGHSPARPFDFDDAYQRVKH
jgi:hypothetical protein